MPIPSPRKGQSKEAFISKCMGDSVMVKEYEQSQRAAICYQKWRDKKAKAAYVIQANGDEYLYTVSRVTLSPALAEKLKGLPESSAGKHKVRLKYKSGKAYMGTVSDCEEFETDDDEIEDEDSEMEDVELND